MYQVVVDDNRVWREITAWISQRKRVDPYLLAIREWCAFLGVAPGSAEAAAKFLQVGSMEAAAYKKWMEVQPGFASGKNASDKRGAATIRQRLFILKKMYKVIAGLGVRCPDPFVLIKIPREGCGQKQPTRAVPFNKVREILALPDSNTDRGKMESALLSVAFGGGCRRGEIVKLEMRDIDVTEKGNVFIRIRESKNGKDDTQVLPAWAAANLQRWLGVRRKIQAGHRDPVFVSCRKVGRKGRGLSESTLKRIFKLYIAKVGLDPALYSPHSARATAVTKLRADGIDPREVKVFGRFASIEMVDHYDKRFNGLDEQAGSLLEY